MAQLPDKLKILQQGRSNVVVPPKIKPKQVARPVNRPMPSALINKQLSVWEQLERNPQFMNVFNKYNASAGNAFAQLKKQKHDVKGRAVEAQMLTGIMERPLTPVAVLLARAGVGKSALVEDFIKKVDNNQLDTVEGRRYFVVSLRVGYLKALGNDKLQSVITGMLDELHKLETLARQVLKDDGVRIILFIDEMHMLVTIFGPGTKIGGDLMKDILARCPIRVITATTRREYDSTVAVDEPFKERFKEIELNELPKPILLEIMDNWWKSNAGHLPMPSRDVFSKILDANALYRSSSAEPRKSLDILEDLVSMKMRYPSKPINESTVSEIFNTRFHIKLDFTFDADKVFENVRKRVRGQGLALYELQRALRTVAFQLDPIGNKPIMTLLLSGATGTGKAVACQDFTRTLNGFKQNKDIKVGDYLFDRQGKPTKVLGVYPQGKREMYKLTFADGRSMIADGEHLFSFYTYKQKTKAELNKYVNGRPPYHTQTVKWIYDQDTKKVETNGRRKIKYYIPMNNAIILPDKNYHIDPYIIGSLLGDGCLTHKELSISSADSESMYEIAKLLPFDCKPVNNASNYNWYFKLEDHVDYSEYSDNKQIKRVQRDWVLRDVPELINSVSDNKFIPEMYKDGSIEQRWALIQGLFDTDGSIVNTDRYNVSFTSISKQLVDDVQEVLYSLGISSSIRMDNRYLKDAKRKPAYTLHVKCTAETKRNFFRLSRKLTIVEDAVAFKKTKTRVKKFEFVGIADIEPLNTKMDAVCFLVDNDEHLFQTTKQYIVTHNTETTKAMAEALYPGEEVIRFFNMTDYKNPELEPQFRKQLGETVRHTPNAVVLLDEFEKASNAIQDSMLAILDEGVVNFEVMNREGQVEMHNQSLRNTIIIVTTNAGHEIYQNDALFAQSNDGFAVTAQSKNEYEQLRRSLEAFLKSAGFRPEMLGRFNRIIPYRALSEKVLVDIADGSINKLIDKFKNRKGIEINVPVRGKWPTNDGDFVESSDVAAFIATIRAKADDSTSGGARTIQREITSSLQDELIDYIIDHPNSTKFEIKVSKDARLYDRGASASEGGIIVHALN